MTIDVLATATLAARAELGWRDPDGHVRATAVVPLVVDDAIVAALPFSAAATAAGLDAAPAVTVVFSDVRMAHRGWRPCAVPAAVDVSADRDGDWTWTGALDQEVRKYPPSRLLIDTPIQRREHWWYVPRWIVRMRPVAQAHAVARRQGPGDGVLFDSDGPAPTARTVAVDDWDAASLRLTALDRSAGPLSGAGPAAVFTHDFSIPDQERASALAVRGERDGRTVAVAARDGHRDLPPATLWRRLAAHARTERACRRALAAYDAGSPSAAAT